MAVPLLEPTFLKYSKIIEDKPCSNMVWSLIFVLLWAHDTWLVLPFQQQVISLIRQQDEAAMRAEMHTGRIANTDIKNTFFIVLFNFLYH